MTHDTSSADVVGGLGVGWLKSDPCSDHGRLFRVHVVCNGLVNVMQRYHDQALAADAARVTHGERRSATSCLDALIDGVDSTTLTNLALTPGVESVVHETASS